MADRVRLALVGCGLITRNSHLPAVLRSPHAEVAALVDSSLERAAALAQQYGSSATLSDSLEKVIGQCDGVVVATPNHTHAPVARVALERDIPVLIEKPLTNTVAEGEALCRLAEQHQTFIAVGYRTRFHPAVLAMKRLLDGGHLGRVESFRYEFGSRGGWAPISAYNLDRAQSGGGVLVVSGTHFLDRMLYWFGEPSSFDFADDSFGGVEANCRATMRYDGPHGTFTGTLLLSKTTALRNRFTMWTDRYDVELGESETEDITLYPRDLPEYRQLLGARTPATDGKPDYFQAQIDDFARAIRGGGKPMVDGWDGLRSVRLFEALYAQRTQLEEPWMWFQKASAASARG